jgi:hypothetical protein
VRKSCVNNSGDEGLFPQHLGRQHPQFHVPGQPLPLVALIPGKEALFARVGDQHLGQPEEGDQVAAVQVSDGLGE